jgi:hypothetical protein
MWDGETGTFIGVPCSLFQFEVPPSALSQQALANLGGAINDTAGKIERGGNSFNEYFCSCVVAVKELIE